MNEKIKIKINFNLKLKINVNFFTLKEVHLIQHELFLDGRRTWEILYSQKKKEEKKISETEVAISKATTYRESILKKLPPKKYMEDMILHTWLSSHVKTSELIPNVFHDLYN